VHLKLLHLFGQYAGIVAKADNEYSALGEFTPHFNPATVVFHNPLYDVQPDAGTFDVRVQTLEHAKKFRQLLCADSQPVIRNGQYYLGVFPMGCYFNARRTVR
jgi:hypothetical protein